MNQHDNVDLVDFLEVPITEERPWVVFSACRQVDPDVFFPTTREQEEHAISICKTCPVRMDCLDYAIEAREKFGIWGGLTEKQRRRLVRRSA